jgi:hypothetical protein
MGWSFRKSIGMGPLRLNLSKSGVGGSFGIGPFRLGRSATGRTYRTASIPGTGISWRSSKGGQQGVEGGGCCGCGGAVALLALLALAAAIAAGVWWLRSQGAAAPSP